MNTLVSLILAASLLLGGGATVAAAQDDLPNQPLYQLKLWTENAKMAMTGDPQDQANLLMNMAQARAQEMVALAEQGVTPPDQVRERLEEHLRQTLKLAAGMDAATREGTLLQLRNRLQTQIRIMEQLQTNSYAEVEPMLTRTRQMLQSHLQLVDQGLADPQGFQYMMENQMQYGQDEEAIPEPNQQGEPGFHQDDESGKPAEIPGGPNSDNLQNGNGDSVSGKETHSGQNSNGGSCAGAECGGGDSGAGNCSGSGCNDGHDGGGGGNN